MKAWETLSSRVLLDCSPWLRVSSEHVRLPNDVQIADFYRIDMPEWSQVFAITDDGRVPMVEHYKHGPGVVSLELPAGYLEADEDTETGARRELLEETGFEASSWRYLGRYFLDGNRGCGGSHLFVARGAVQVSEPRCEESEILTLRLLTLDEVRAAWIGGQIRNIATAAAVGLALALVEGGL